MDHRGQRVTFRGAQILESLAIHETRPNQPRFSRLARNLFAGTLALVPLWALGQFVRDQTWFTGLCFYIPSPFLAVAMIGWTVFHTARRRWQAAVLSACLALVPCGAVLFAENRFFAACPTAAAGCVRLVHWNVAGNLSDRARVFLATNRAELLVLNEIPDAESVGALHRALGHEYHSQAAGNLAVIAAGEVTSLDWLINRQRIKVLAATCLLKGRSVRLLVVDLPSEIHIHRDPLLREINTLIEQHRPDLIVGDFNAPRRSQALCELPDGYRNAFDTAGSGCGYTWPVPVPMYALDHCIHSPQVIPGRYELKSSFCSDHRLQVFDFTWSEPGHE